MEGVHVDLSSGDATRAATSLRNSLRLGRKLLSKKLAGRGAATVARLEAFFDKLDAEAAALTPGNLVAVSGAFIQACLEAGKKDSYGAYDAAERCLRCCRVTDRAVLLAQPPSEVAVALSRVWPVCRALEMLTQAPLLLRVVLEEALSRQVKDAVKSLLSPGGEAQLSQQTWDRLLDAGRAFAWLHFNGAARARGERSHVGDEACLRRLLGGECELPRYPAGMACYGAQRRAAGYEPDGRTFSMRAPPDMANTPLWFSLFGLRVIDMPMPSEVREAQERAHLNGAGFVLQEVVLLAMYVRGLAAAERAHVISRLSEMDNVSCQFTRHFERWVSYRGADGARRPERSDLDGAVAMVSLIAPRVSRLIKSLLSHNPDGVQGLNKVYASIAGQEEATLITSKIAFVTCLSFPPPPADGVPEDELAEFCKIQFTCLMESYACAAIASYPKLDHPAISSMDSDGRLSRAAFMDLAAHLFCPEPPPCRTLCMTDCCADFDDSLIMNRSSSVSISCCALCGASCATRKCSRCLSVTYCDRKCQVAHWRAAHKRECAPARAVSSAGHVESA